MWDQFKRLSGSLTRKQQITIALTAVAVVAGLYVLLLRNREKDFRPLFTGLAAEDANKVVTKLKEANVEYRLGEDGAVLVRSAKLAETRLVIAGAGLPKTGRIGFELFDKTNFGATDFAEQVNYRRALEGELERSMVSLAEVSEARVHLTFPKQSLFTEQRQPAKASVLLKLNPDAQLSPRNVLAIEHLVASAVEGLTPEQVTVVDMQGNLLKKVPATPDEEENKDLRLEYRQKIERDLHAKVTATLTPVIGAEHFQTGVAVDVDFSSGEQSEEAWDPDRSVMVTQQRTEEMNTPATPSGVPGTASSLPRPTSRPGSKDQGLMRRTENITYQSSRTVRRTTLPQGGIRRLTVSTVLDQGVRWEGTGAKAKRILEPPSEETLKKVRDLIAGAVGFNQERGDQIVVESLPFESTLRKSLPPPDPAAPKAPGKAPAPQQSAPFLQGIEKWLADKGIKLNPMILTGVAALLALILFGGAGFFFVKKRKKKALALAKASAATASGAAMEGLGELPPAHTKLPATHGGSAVARPGADPELSEEERQELIAQQERELLASLRGPEQITKKTEVLVKHITEQTKQNPVGAAHLIRSWLTEKER
ncbi:MAG: flagellar M-ring protein FliF [Bryobacterales bacterium]|nr:flagellar M-ring protein FliF [Bryobacterales bacterium]